MKANWTTTLLSLVSLFVLAAPAIAQSDALAGVANDVKQVCSQPATNGEHWKVQGAVAGEAGVQIKLLKLGDVKGNIGFTKDEWSGVQAVLAQDQPGDNASYRTCVQTLTPLFLAKIPQPVSRLDGIVRMASSYDEDLGRTGDGVRFAESSTSQDCKRLQAQIRMISHPPFSLHAEAMAIPSDSTPEQLQRFSDHLQTNHSQGLQAVSMLGNRASSLGCLA